MSSEKAWCRCDREESGDSCVQRDVIGVCCCEIHSCAEMEVADIKPRGRAPDATREPGKRRSSRLRQMYVVLLILLLANGAEAQSFTTKSIGQSNPIAGASNTITVTLTTDTILTAAASSVVTLTGPRPRSPLLPYHRHSLEAMENDSDFYLLKIWSRRSLRNRIGLCNGFRRRCHADGRVQQELSHPGFETVLLTFLC
jgi:hypothetical protein